MRVAWLPMRPETLKGHLDGMLLAALEPGPRHGYAIMEVLRAGSGGQFDLDRKSVVEGKSVDFGGRRIIKKKKRNSGGPIHIPGSSLQWMTAESGRWIGASSVERPACWPRRAGRKTPLPWDFFFSSRRRHTRLQGDWSSDVCSSD